MNEAWWSILTAFPDDFEYISDFKRKTQEKKLDKVSKGKCEESLHIFNEMFRLS